MSLVPASSESAFGAANTVAYLRDEEASGTEGGAFTSGSFQTRVLNTKVFDVGGMVTLAANQFTLQPGTYQIEARAPAFQVGRHKLRLRDITAGATVIVGGGGLYLDPTRGASNDAHLSGQVTPTVATTYELQHQCENTALTNGLGVAASFGVTEVYAEVLISRTA